MNLIVEVSMKIKNLFQNLGCQVCWQEMVSIYLLFKRFHVKTGGSNKCFLIGLIRKLDFICCYNDNFINSNHWHIRTHWSSSSDCRRKRSFSSSTTWRAARRSIWQRRHSRNRAGGFTQSTWCGSNGMRSPRSSMRSMNRCSQLWLLSMLHII